MPCLGLLVTACDGKKQAPADAAAVSDPHGDAIRELLKAPRRFQEVAATIRDEASYDRAVPGLTEVVNQFQSAAEAFRKLNPPAEPDQAKYRQMIADGFRGTEPTGEDMISLITIKNREKEISQWMEEFMAAGQEAGAEALRLYGKIDYPTGAGEKPFELDFGGGKAVPLPSPPPRPVDQAGGASNPLLQHLGREPDEDGR